MRAIAMWIGASTKRHLASTVSLVLIAGLSLGVVAAVFAAARRSESTLARYRQNSAAFDGIVGGCPPGVDPAQLNGQAEFLAKCTNRNVAERLRTEVVAPAPGVTATGLVGVGVVGILDPSSPNGWGHGVLVFYQLTPGVETGRPIVVQGRMPNPAAPDEVVLGERAAQRSGIEVGDELQLGSWPQDQLDQAIDSDERPQTDVFRSRVVGIVRFLVDAEDHGADAGTHLPDAMYAAAGWGVAHGDSIAGYGANIGVRLADGLAGAPALLEAVSAAGWKADISQAEDADLGSLSRSLDVERQAVLVAGAIAAIAVAVLIGLLLLAQLRSELSSARQLIALGMRPCDLAWAAMLRAITIALAAAAVATIVAVVLSPLGPFGLARRLEFSHTVRADWLVFGPVAAAALMLAAGVGLAAARRASRRVEKRAVRSIRTGVPLGPVARGGLSFARGGTARTVTAVTAMALCSAVVAGGLVADLDMVLRHPARYGAPWTAVIGQYSEPSAVDEAVGRLRTNPDVIQAAGLYDTPSGVAIDGTETPVLALETYVGNPAPVLTEGRAPTGALEVALGRGTANELGKRVGDEVRIAPVDGSDPGFDVTVVGIAVLDNPITPARNAGEGAFVSVDIAKRASTSVPQSIVVWLSADADPDAALAHLTTDFRGSIRTPTPQADLANLQRLRTVPWLLAALVSFLALAALVHSVATLIRRHRRELAVLAASGMTRRQRLGAGACTVTVLVGAGAMIGLPLGVIGSRMIWRVVAQRIFIPAQPGVPWTTVVVTGAVAMAIGGAVAIISGWWQQRHPLAAILRAE